MKKVLLMLAFILPMACCFVGCSSENDEPTKKELIETDIYSLQGTWAVSKVEEFKFPGERKFLVKKNRIVVFMKLTSDVNFEEVDEYTFTYSGMTLTLTNVYSGEVGAILEVLSFSENNIKVKLTDLEYGYGTYTMHLTREK